MRLKSESRGLAIFRIVTVAFPRETAACLDLFSQMLPRCQFSSFSWLNIYMNCLVLLRFIHSMRTCGAVCLLLSYFMWKDIS